jgi:hypothetical protein
MAFILLSTDFSMMFLVSNSFSCLLGSSAVLSLLLTVGVFVGHVIFAPLAFGNDGTHVLLFTPTNGVFVCYLFWPEYPSIRRGHVV